MPAAEFSEFSYGFAVVRQTEALLTSIGAKLQEAPTLPSLLTENKVGYDARLVTVDFTLFLQFKRSYYVSRRHPREPCGYAGGQPHCTWAYWGSEHYRFEADTDSNQFDAMRDHEARAAAGSVSGLSLYVAPNFYLQADLDDAYLRDMILARSVAIPPSVFDSVASGSHHFSFDPAMHAGVVTSEPLPMKPKPAIDVITRAAAAAFESHDDDRPTLADLGSWAADRSAAISLLPDFDRSSAVSTLAFLRDFAGLMGGAWILLGHANAAEVTGSEPLAQ